MRFKLLLLSTLNTKRIVLNPLSVLISKRSQLFIEMAKISIMGLTALIVFFSWSVSICDSLEASGFDEDNSGSFFTVSSFRYPKSQVRPYDTRYIRGLFSSDDLIFLYWFNFVLSSYFFFMYMGACSDSVQLSCLHGSLR